MPLGGQYALILFHAVPNVHRPLIHKVSISSFCAPFVTAVAQLASIPVGDKSTPSEYRRSVSTLKSDMVAATQTLRARFDECKRCLKAQYESDKLCRLNPSEPCSFSIEPTSVLLASDASMERMISSVREGY